MVQPSSLAAWAAQGKPVQTGVSRVGEITSKYIRLLMLFALGVTLLSIASALDTRGVRVRVRVCRAFKPRNPSDCGAHAWIIKPCIS